MSKTLNDIMSLLLMTDNLGYAT